MISPGPLAEFLRAKRAELPPDCTPLAGYGARRRVSGLRREEVAQLGGVSIGYYTRLEQGHSRHASDEVLLSIARALQLTVTETEHLLDLSRARAPRDGSAAPLIEVAGPAALAMLASLTERPALLLGRRNDVLAWNRLGHALLAPHLPFSAPSILSERPSMARLLFLDPAARALHVDWSAEARQLVAYHRMISGRYPDDTALTALVGELVMKDPDFAAFWAEGRVGECVAGSVRFRHPTAGEFRASYAVWAQASYPEHRIEVYEPEDVDRVISALRGVPIAGLPIAGADSPAQPLLA